MSKARIGQNISRLTIVVIAALLVLAVMSLMSYVQNLLSSDVKINLTEIVTQNKDVISSRLKTEIFGIDATGSQIVDRMTRGGAEAMDMQAAFLDYCSTNADSQMYIADTEGKALFPDGSTLDIAGRKYFKLAVEGTQNISDRIVSRLTGEEMFVFAVPLRRGDTVIGTLQCMYTPEQMYKICDLSLFSSQGSMSIINSDGYIVVGSSGGTYNNEHDNYYRAIYAEGNVQATKQLQDDITGNRPGFMETKEQGEAYFSAYTPLEEVHDWYLITSVSTNAVSPNATIVVDMFYGILLLVVGCFTVALLWFFSYKRRQQKNLEQAAFVDPVTGGATFSKFALDMEQYLSTNSQVPCYLLFFDIDNFKYINSYYGFDFGDGVLKSIHSAVVDLLEPGEMIARMSGDRFVALLLNAEEARLNALVNACEQERVQIYLSAGVFQVEDRRESISLMADKASTAALESKGSLHKRVEWYSKDTEEQLAYNEQLKRAVERALADDEFVAYFQPKVDIETGRLVGAEALVRWPRNDGTLVSPLDFIPLCEKTGLVVDLDMSVLRKTLSFLKKSLDAGVSCVPISVNFSRLHLLDEDFLDNLMAELAAYEIPPHLIELELTESIMFDGVDVIGSFVHRVHSKGLRISMDDFGSGYSSLNMLKDIPIDVLKIDQAFLRETENSERLSAIFLAIAHMAKSLDMYVVVEGIETQENIELMRKSNLRIAQGYFFARPMDEESFGEVFRKGAL